MGLFDGARAFGHWLNGYGIVPDFVVQQGRVAWWDDHDLLFAHKYWELYPEQAPTTIYEGWKDKSWHQKHNLPSLDKDGKMYPPGGRLVAGRVLPLSDFYGEENEWVWPESQPGCRPQPQVYVDFLGRTM